MRFIEKDLLGETVLVAFNDSGIPMDEG